MNFSVGMELMVGVEVEAIEGAGVLVVVVVCDEEFAVKSGNGAR